MRPMRLDEGMSWDFWKIKQEFHRGPFCPTVGGNVGADVCMCATEFLFSESLKDILRIEWNV